MSIREILEKALYSFPIIFSYAILGAWASFWLITGKFPFSGLVWEIFVVIIPIVLARFSFYSRHELSVRQMAFRHGIHFLLIVTILLTASYLLEWYLHGDFFIQSVILVGLVTIIYALVLGMEELRSKRLANELMKRLEQRR